MRFIVAVFAILQLVSTKNTLEERFVETLKTTLECYRGLLKEGIPDLEIPSLDPIEIGDLEFDLDEDLIKGNVQLFDLKLAGLTTFAIKDIGFGIIPPKLTFDLTINLTLTGDYEIDSTIINIIPLAGKGNLDLKLGLNFFGKILISTKNIEELYLFTAVEPNFKITGLLGDENMSSLISRQVAAIVDEFVNKNKEEISKEVSPALKDLINLIIMIIKNMRSVSLRKTVQENVSGGFMPIIEKLLEKVGDVDFGNFGTLLDLCPTGKELERLLQEAEAQK